MYVFSNLRRCKSYTNSLTRFLVGDSKSARDDLQAALAIVPGFIHAWVKIASVHMELGDTDATFAAFASALAHDPTNPDIYYHRGQGMLIFDNLQRRTALRHSG